MKLQVLSFSGESFLHDDVKSVNLKTKDGEITILSDHADLTSVLVPGVVFVDLDGKNEEKFAIGWGVIEVSDNQVKVMTDMLTDSASADASKAEEAIAKAQALMEQYKDSKDRVDMEKFVDAEDMLLKSLANLKLSEMIK